MTTRQYDANDPEQIARRQNRDTLRRQQREADWKWLLDDPRGRRVVSDLMRDFGFISLSHTPGDALQTAFREGKRSCALALHATFTAISQEASSDILQGLIQGNG